MENETGMGKVSQMRNSHPQPRFYLSRDGDGNEDGFGGRGWGQGW